MFGLEGKSNVLHLINYSFARRFQHDKTCKHLKIGSAKGLIGTARYSSINSHRIEQSRRDDLESVGYVLLYFLGEELPWQGIKGQKGQSRKQVQEQISEKKRTTPLTDLCRNFPPIFEYLKYCRTLKFDQKPNYCRLKQKLRLYFIQQGYTYDNAFDWTFDM